MNPPRGPAVPASRHYIDLGAPLLEENRTPMTFELANYSDWLDGRFARLSGPHGASGREIAPAAFLPARGVARRTPDDFGPEARAGGVRSVSNRP